MEVLFDGSGWNNNHISKLPIDLVHDFLVNYLDLESLKIFPTICKSWMLIEEKATSLWTKLTQRKFGELVPSGLCRSNPNPNKAVYFQLDRESYFTPSKRKILKDMKQFYFGPVLAGVCVLTTIEEYLKNNEVTDILFTISGPENTPYEEGLFILEIKFPEEYPLLPPIITFLTKIYHPNVSSGGIPNLDILKKNDGWLKSGMRTPHIISKIITSLQNLLREPKPDDISARPEVAEIYKTNQLLYDETVKEWVKEYASAMSFFS